MPTVTLSTHNGETALELPSAELTSKETTPEGLRQAFLRATGQQAFVLHDGGLSLGVASERYWVRLEGMTTARDLYEPLEHARAWQKPGWFNQTLGWLSGVLGEGIVSTEQISTNDLACVLRVKTGQQTLYLKASETGLEADLTAQLVSLHPDLFPRVMAWDVQRKVLVTQDCGQHLSEEPTLPSWNTAVQKLAQFQTTRDARSLQTLGCPVYDFQTLADRAETFLRDAETLQGWGLTDAQTTRLEAQLPRIRKAHEQVLALELPLLPAHGDAHPMNALTGCGGVWFDLSEACVAHPLLDVGWFLAWLSHPARATLPSRQAYPDAAARLWSGYLQAARMLEAEPLRLEVMILALTHRALVYHERFQTWQGTVPGWRPQHTPYCLRSLLKVL